MMTWPEVPAKGASGGYAGRNMRTCSDGQSLPASCLPGPGVAGSVAYVPPLMGSPHLLAGGQSEAQRQPLS